MSGPRPPRALESWIERVVREQEGGAALVGDMAEGWAHVRARSGHTRALIWYAWQALSLTLWRRPYRSVEGSARRAAGRPERMAMVLRATLRGIRHRPGFTLAVTGVLTLALGMTLAAFSVARGTFEASRWWQDEARAVLIWPEFRFSRGMLSVLREESEVFDVVGGVLRQPAVVTLADRSASVASVSLSPELFQSLRARPVLGRGLQPEDALPGAEPVLVMGHALWRGAFGGAPEMVGSVVEVSGVRRRVVGVMPAGAEQPGPGTEVWTALALDMADPDFWPARELEVAAITRAGVTVAEARADVRRVLGVLARRFAFFFRPDFGTDATVIASSDVEWARAAGPLLLLLAGTGLLLLVAAIDVGNLVLARSLERRVEMRVRLALGASRWQVAQQFVAEAGLHAGVAGAAGVVLGVALASRIPALFPFGANVVPIAATDPALIGFALGVTAAAWMLMAGIPVLHFLGVTSAAVAPRGVRDRAARGLVVAQAALATALLVVAALLLRTVQSLEQLPLGFDPAATAIAVAPPSSALSTAELVSLHDRVAQRIAGPGSGESAGWISALPLQDVVLTSPVNPEDAPVQVAEAVTAGRFVADQGALDALRVRIIEGRGFTAGDDARSTPVALVNEALARALWPAGEAVGRRIAVDPHDWTRWITIVGIVSDVRYGDLSFPVRPAFILPRAQAPARSMRLIVRPSSGVDDARAALRAIAPELAIGEPRALAAVVRDAQGPARVLTRLLGALALLATTLGAIGLYGALAGWVARRRTEIGTRLALGAKPRALSLGVMSSGIALTAFGTAVGLALAAGASRALRGLLFGVSPMDPLAFLMPVLLLLVTGVLAAALPALRAARVPPAQALRDS